MKGKIKINKNLCKGCGYCITACPRELIVFDSTVNAIAVHPAVQKDTGSCNGCGLCAIVCPDIAIEIWRDGSTSSPSRAKLKGRSRGKSKAK